MTTTTITRRIGALVLLLGLLAGLVVYPSPKVPLASVRQAAETIASYVLTEAKGVVRPAAVERAGDPTVPDPLFLHALTPTLAVLAPPSAASFRLAWAVTRALYRRAGQKVHPPRAPPAA
ncbi:hypothetical protein PVT71_27735 (plasmid) [Salipiger sp. H15]|uniref:DUF4235 domain-containing protein n=1 Tax=Alloyangia sp. H15 TaxID=3029062 RepID=A0AAU8ASD9_9RHOB